MGSHGLTLVVLCGGESLRFGSDKAMAVWRGRSLVEHALAHAKQLPVDKTILIAGRRPHRFWGLVTSEVGVTSDPGEGPAEALRFYLSEHPGPCLVIPVDMPYLSAETLLRFLERSQGSTAILGDSRATLPCRIDTGFRRTKEASLGAALKAAGARRIDPNDIDCSVAELRNINRSDDLVE